MIIYNKAWLANLRLQSVLKKDHRSGYITDNELNLVKKIYPVGFYSPGIFARVGLFTLTCIIALFSGGLLTLLFMTTGVLDSPVWLFVLGAFCYLALELMVTQKNHHRSGVDDALLFMTGILISIGIYWMLSEINNFNADNIPLSGMILVISLYFSLRFADTLMATVSCIAFFAFIFFTWTRVIPAGLATAPFMMMLLSAFTYWLIAKNAREEQLIDYENCFIIAQVVVLTVLYAAGNYYVIQTLGSQLNADAAGKPFPFGWFFWIWTILVPFAYVFLGLKLKNVILLRAGLLLIIIAVLTFRTYYHVLPIDVALTLAGAILLTVDYAAVKYLRIPKHGFTYAEPDNEHLMDRLKIESLIVAETFADTGSPTADGGTKFGGGDFGGGGSGSNF